jgi:DNA-binding PadR family transcriptional regulator
MSRTGAVILGLVALRPRSGYEIKAAVDSSTRFFWAASYGQIYPELKRLEEGGLIAGEPAPRGARRRRVFRITPAGREAFDAWLAQPEFSWELRDEGLLKLFFADLLPPAAALELVRARRAAHERFLARLRAIQPGPGPVAGAARFPDLVLEYGIGMNEWAIGWCDEVERALSSADERPG